METFVYDELSALNRTRDLDAQERQRIAQEEDDRKNPSFVQLDIRRMKKIREYLRENPLSIDIFLFIAEYMGRDNILICSLSVLMEETGKSRSTIQRAIRFLREKNVITTVKFGSCTGYAVDGNYVWKTFHHAGKYAVFENARALASRAENESVVKKLATVFKNSASKDED